MVWKSAQLGNIIDIKHGHAFDGGFFSDSGEYILLTPGNCREEGGLKLKGEKEKYYIGEIPKDYLLKTGDMLVVMTDLVNTAPILGGSFIIPEDNRFLHNQRLGLVVIKNQNKINKLFLYYLLNTHSYRSQVRGSASGATVRHTSPNRIKACQLQIPVDIAYQEKIGNTLSAYDDLIENNQRRIKLLEEAARLLYREWFVHFRFPGYEHVRVVNGVPEGWEHSILSRFYDTTSGGTPSRTNPTFFTGDILWVKTQELLDSFLINIDEKITEDAMKNSAAKLFPKGTVLVAMYGATIGQLGILAFPAASNQACCAIIPKDVRASFIHAFLFFRENKEKLVNLSMGAAQKNINQQIIRSFPMLMPTSYLMFTFCEILKPVFSQWLNLQYQYEKLKTARDLLLPRLMNGEISL